MLAQQPPERVGGARAASPLDAGRARYRRALTLLLLTLVLPGSAQLIAGHRRLGRVALGIAATVVGTALALAVVGLLRPQVVLEVVTHTLALDVLQGMLAVLALGWLALFADAWRLGRPLALERPQRLTVFSVTSVLAIAVAGALLVASHLVGVQRDLVAGLFADGAAAGAIDGRYNILLLGGDAGPDRVGLRPDSITLVSVDAVTGRTVMFGLPRNMEDVPFPAGTVMNRRFPHGFRCSDCLLNAVYTWADTHPRLFPGVAEPGIEATKDAVEGVTGLQVGYTVLVDLGGFQDLIDALGGIRVDVGTRVPIGGGAAPISGYIEPGLQRLDGFHALWFSRSREGTSDYDRMARQKCVLAAMANQLDPAQVMSRFQQIASASQEIVETDIPRADVANLLEAARRASGQPFTQVSLMPPLVEPWDADYEQVHEIVARVLAGDPAVQRPARNAAAQRPDGRPTSAARPTRDSRPQRPQAGIPAAEAGIVCRAVEG